MTSPTAGNILFLTKEEAAKLPNYIPGIMTPEALYELKLDTVRKFVNHIHRNNCFIAQQHSSLSPDLTRLMLDFVEGEAK